MLSFTQVNSSGQVTMALLDGQNTSVFLVTKNTKKYGTSRDIIRELYLNKLLIHPDQINDMIFSHKQEANNDNVMLIEFIMRSQTEQYLFIFKILNDSKLKLSQELWFSPYDCNENKLLDQYELLNQIQTRLN